MSVGQLTPGISIKMYFPWKYNLHDFVKKNTRQMTVYIFLQGAKETAIFYSKFDVLEFLDIDNLHKKFGSDISKIVDFFLLSKFCSHFFSFDSIDKQRNYH